MKWFPRVIVVDVYENTNPELFPMPTIQHKERNIYKMVQKKDAPGIIEVNGQSYFITGITKVKSESIKTGRIAGGAAIGGILVGPVGAMVGGALGSSKQDDNIYEINFKTIDMEKEFSVLGKVDKRAIKNIKKLTLKGED